MNRFFKTAILSAAVAATTLATLPAANAGDRYWRNNGRHYHNNHSDGGDLAVAGILGLAAGALVVGLASQPAPAYEYSYRRPTRVYREQGLSQRLRGRPRAVEPRMVRLLFRPLPQLQPAVRHLRRL